MPEFEMPEFSTTMAAAFEAAEKGETYQPPEPAPEQVAAPEAGDDPAPDEQATEQISDPGDAPEGEPAADAPPLSPPERWSADDKAAFAALPREAQDLVLKRERDVEGYLSKRTQELSSQGKTYESLEQVLAPRRQSLSIAYGSVENGLNTLFALSDMAEKDPAGFINYFAQQRGIDLSALQKGGEADESADPEITAIRREIAQERQYREQQQREAQAARDRELSTQVERFKAEKNDKGEILRPHFDSVRTHMGALLEKGAAQDLQDAYDQAVWANPETRKALMDSHAKAEQAKRVAEAKAKAAAAEKAASTRPRSSNGQFVSSPGKTIEETMAAAYEAHNG